MPPFYVVLLKILEEKGKRAYFSIFFQKTLFLKNFANEVFHPFTPGCRKGRSSVIIKQVRERERTFLFSNIWSVKAKIKGVAIIWERHPVILIDIENGEEAFLIYSSTYITEWKTYYNIWWVHSFFTVFSWFENNAGILSNAGGVRWASKHKRWSVRWKLH